MGSKTSSPYRQVVEKQIKEHPVLMYSTTYCSWCVKAKNVFNLFKVNPHVVYIDRVKDGEEIAIAIYEITGQDTVPCIFIGGNYIGGFSHLMQGLRSGKIQSEFRRLEIHFEDSTF